jgi:iron complex outermembrane recepter protein
MLKILITIGFLVLESLSSAYAQHAADNPVVSADDGFGLTIGIESTGIYNPGSIRGFNPQVAGNVRIDGLYFDQQGGLTNRIIEGSTVRVGISEIGYAFPAPTGIVDYDLRHASNGAPTASIIAEAGPFDIRSFSVDGSVPLVSKELQLPLGVSYQIGGPPSTGPNLGYTARIANVGAAPQWQPNDRVTVRMFVDWQDITHSQTVPIIFSDGTALPPEISRGYYGQRWAEAHTVTENYGATVDARLSSDWTLAAGLFHSLLDQPVSYADLYLDTLPTGLADHVIVGYPDQEVGSTSGEARLTGHFPYGTGFNDIVFSVRGRDTLAHYGGSDAVDEGEAYINEGTQLAAPVFVYGPTTRDSTKLWSVGVAYHGRWRRLVEYSVGLQNEHYDKTVAPPNLPTSHLTDDPWRLYGSAAAPLTHDLSAYTDYTQGFEDSGSAPNTAANPGAILPTTRTWQVDGGLRYRLTPKLSLIAGAFELNKPYFSLDTHNVDRALGEQRASGTEISLAGQITSTLNVNLGAVVGEVHILGPNLAADGVGTNAVGQPHNQFLLNIDYGFPRWPAWSADLGVYHFGTVPGTVDNALWVSSVTTVNVGSRYRFSLLGAQSTLRVQVQNLTNAYIWNIGLNPGFVQFAPRSVIAYVTVDLV